MGHRDSCISWNLILVDSVLLRCQPNRRIWHRPHAQNYTRQSGRSKIQLIELSEGVRCSPTRRRTHVLTGCTLKQHPWCGHAVNGISTQAHWGLQTHTIITHCDSLHLILYPMWQTLLRDRFSKRCCGPWHKQLFRLPKTSCSTHIGVHMKPLLLLRGDRRGNMTRTSWKF